MFVGISRLVVLTVEDGKLPVIFGNRKHAKLGEKSLCSDFMKTSEFSSRRKSYCLYQRFVSCVEIFNFLKHFPK